MPKHDRRARRRAAAPHARARPGDSAAGPSDNAAGPSDSVREPSDSLARPDVRDHQSLVNRILEIPHLAQVVPRLPPEMLHRVIQSCGLEDCGELIALATPDQLTRVFDLDLWRSDHPGIDERFDADRFGVWLEVLAESGPTVAAQKLAEMNVDLVIAALAQHAFVFDPAALLRAVDAEDVDTDRSLNGALRSEVGGYLLVARRADSWNAILAVLIALDKHHHDCFDRVMRGCRALSDSTPEIDGLDNLMSATEQVMFDVALDRERRRENQGFVTPAQARAFLQMSRQLPLGHRTPPHDNPVAGAYFRAIEWPAPPAADNESSGSPVESGAPSTSDSPDTVAVLVELLAQAGVVSQPPRALLDGPQGDAPRLSRIRAHMHLARERDAAAYSIRSQELAYLANAMVAGCSIQGRPFTLEEASEAAVAVCNLGLENWPLQWIPKPTRGSSSAAGPGAALPDDFLVGHDLVGVFQVGWTVLHENVCVHTAEQLITILKRLRFEDRDIRNGLTVLRIELAKHVRAGAPWRARDALDVIAILDMPAWAALLGLIDECPVMHAAIGACRRAGTLAVSATRFEFISDNSQIEDVRQFMQALPATLRC
jgi:hypothetical protein